MITVKLNKKNLVTLGSTAAIALTMTTGLVAAPTAAQADTRGTWEGVAIAGALLGGYGLAQHNSTDAVIGGAATIVGLSQLSGGHDQGGRDFGGYHGGGARQDRDDRGSNNFVAPDRNDGRDARDFGDNGDNRGSNADSNRAPQRFASNNSGGGWNR